MTTLAQMLDLAFQYHQRGHLQQADPFGYSLEKDHKTLVPVSAEQEVICAIFELRGKGVTLRKIAAELGRRGVQTKEGNSNWTHTAVARILDRGPKDDQSQVA